MIKTLTKIFALSIALGLISIVNGLSSFPKIKTVKKNNLIMFFIIITYKKDIRIRN